MRLLNNNLKLGQANKKMSFFGYKISLLGLAGFRGLYKQGVDFYHLTKYVRL